MNEFFISINILVTKNFTSIALEVKLGAVIINHTVCVFLL